MKKILNLQNNLTIENLFFRYEPKTPLIENLSINITNGNIHCVLGPSGCGKSTLLRLIAGLEKVKSGFISINGMIASNKRIHISPENRRVGLVFQDYALFPNKTVLKNITFGINCKTKKEKSIIAIDILKKFKMENFKNRMPHTLSGGQKQRVALARSLANKPKLMLLDEPFSSLDKDTRAEIRDETIALLKSENVPTLLVTHDPKEAETIGDEISWLKR